MPVKEFLDRSMAVQESSIPSSVGIEPLNWLEMNCREVRTLKLPSSFGIEPENWLDWRYILCSPVRSANSEGLRMQESYVRDSSAMLDVQGATMTYSTSSERIVVNFKGE